MSPFEAAVRADVEGLIAVLDLARQIWPEPDKLVWWLTTPQMRWQAQTPMQMIAGGLADDVIEVLNNETIHG